MGNITLPEHAQWRYGLAVTRFQGRADVVLTDRETGHKITHVDVQATYLDPRPRRVAETDLETMVRDMVRMADARRPPGDAIGEAARAAVAVGRLARMHTEAPDHLVAGLDYASALAHIGDLGAELAELAALGAVMCDTYADMAQDVEAERARALWRAARLRLGDVRAGALGAHKAAGATARAVAEAMAYPIDCGDCLDGRCHWGDQGGPLATARAGEAEGQTCGCARHDVSVRLRPRRLALALDNPGDQGGPMPPELLTAQMDAIEAAVDLDDLDDLGGPAAVEAAEQIIGEWYGERVDPAGGLVGRLAAWPAPDSFVPVGVVGSELAGLNWGHADLRAAVAERTDGRSTVVLTDTGRDVAALLLAGLDPHVVGRNLAGDTVFFNTAGRPLPHLAMAGAPAGLSPDVLPQFALEVWGAYRSLAEAVAEAGAVVFDVPGRGALLVPAGADLAEICLRLGADVVDICRRLGVEADTGLDVLIIDDPVQITRAQAVDIARAGVVPPALDAMAFGLRLPAGESAAGDQLAGDLGDKCESPYGACPDHGATLAPAPNRGDGRIYTRCTREACDNVWAYDRIGERCALFATHRASPPDPDSNGTYGGEVIVCKGHAAQLVEWGWSVRTRPGSPGASLAADAALAELCRRAARRRSVITAACELVAGLGYALHEVSDGAPSDRGAFAPIVVRFTGATWAEATFSHDPGADVYTWSAGWAHRPQGNARAATWPALVEMLATSAGAEMPAVVRAAWAATGRTAAAGGVETAGAVAAPPVSTMLGEAGVLGFTVTCAGGAHGEITCTLIGYGHRYDVLMRYERSVAGMVFAGAWEVGAQVADAPVTWSTWGAFVAALCDVAVEGTTAAAGEVEGAGD